MNILLESRMHRNCASPVRRGTDGKGLLMRHLAGGLPYVFIDPAWRAANDRAAVRIAEQIDEQEDFDLVPLLIDALQDAGCADADILAHLRSPGPHVRGCWPVDLVLGLS